MKILHSADWHLREDLPRCRVDSDWLHTQRMVIRELITHANNNSANLTCCGDLFHRPRVADEVVSMLILEACNSVKGLYVWDGNHDLPYHSWDNVERSSFGIIWALIDTKIAPFLPISDLGSAGHWNKELIVKENSDILFIHRLVFENEKSMPPNVAACTAQQLLDEFPEYKWIFTGDMHKAFHYEKGGRHVINPGCINRQSADFEEYSPGAWLVDTELESVKWIPLKSDKNDFVDASYISAEKERDERITDFIETVKIGTSVKLDFADNVESALQTNQINPEVKAEIHNLLYTARGIQ